jgi:hypothetical protein
VAGRKQGKQGKQEKQEKQRKCERQSNFIVVLFLT